jgi:peptidoglycan/xylan/chitin deacetylase (PgdA/CDA1 family)
MLKRLLKVAIALVYWALRRGGRAIARIAGRKPRPNREIIFYHTVPDDCRARFAAQMDMLKRHARPATLDDLEQGDEPGVAVTFDDAFRCVAENAMPELRKRRIPCAIFVPAGWLGKEQPWAVGYPEYDGQIVMSEQELQDLGDEGVLLGSHTIVHRNLSEVDPSEAKKEIVDSKRMLEETFSRPIRHFAFPLGRHSPTLVAQCREAGYERAYAAHPSGLEGYMAGRVEVSVTDWPLEFYLKMTGNYRWQPAATAVKNALRGILGMGTASRKR